MPRFSVGSGSLYAYGVLDDGYRWDLTDEEAVDLGPYLPPAATCTVKNIEACAPTF